MLILVITASKSFYLANSEQQEVINSSKELARADKLVEDRQETVIRISATVKVHQLFLSVMPCCTFLNIFVSINSPYFPS